MTLQDVEELQRVVDKWFIRTTSDMQAMHTNFASQIQAIEDMVSGSGMPPQRPPQLQQQQANSNMGTQRRPVQGLSWEGLLTPSRSAQGGNHDNLSPSLASPPAGHQPINYDSLLDEVQGNNNNNKKSSTAFNTSGGSAADLHRPTPDATGANDMQVAPENRSLPCQVLVEFKRKRILQFESPYYVAPGEYVVVGGDRGEDIGLVTHSWPAGMRNEKPQWTANIGIGKVQRIASVLEVSQLQGVQTELEARAVDVAQEKVVEHQLPMRIIDSEYQFDRKKLTFYYQSQHRLDFRTLVRDLYKTFRARIWMEQDQS